MPLQDAYCIYDIMPIVGDICEQYDEYQARHPEVKDSLDCLEGAGEPPQREWA